MKKIFIALFIIVIFACERDNTRCWNCETVNTIETTGFITQYETEYFTVCDMDSDDIKIFEQARTFTVTINLGTKRATNEQVTKCK